MFGAPKRGRFRSLATLILVVNVVGEVQRKRTLAASRGFLAAARLSCYYYSVNKLIRLLFVIVTSKNTKLTSLLAKCIPHVLYSRSLIFTCLVIGWMSGVVGLSRWKCCIGTRNIACAVRVAGIFRGSSGQRAGCRHQFAVRDVACSSICSANMAASDEAGVWPWHNGVMILHGWSIPSDPSLKRNRK